MKTLKAISLGVLLWILIFIEISITMLGLKLSDTTVWIIHYTLLIPFAILCAGIYYKSKDKINGFALGLVFLIVGIILDMIVTVPLFIIPQGGGYGTYFSNMFMLSGFLELIVLVGIYDLLRRK
jgi:hypothetical protein